MNRVSWFEFEGWAVEFGSSEAHYITVNNVEEPGWTYSSNRHPPSSGTGWEEDANHPGVFLNYQKMKRVPRPRTACGRIFRISHGTQRGNLQFSPAGPEPACEQCKQAQMKGV